MKKESKVSDIGEKELVRLLTAQIITTPDQLDGLGHDAGFFRLELKDGEILAVNTDRSGKNVAEDLGLAGPECSGDFAVSHAVSDIVVAGGVPRFITLALLLPPDTPVSHVRQFMQGAQAAAARYGAPIIAGDTKKSREFACVVTATGTLAQANRITRSGAQPGDLLVATGYPGSMFYALTALRESIALTDDAKEAATQALVWQNPPFAFGVEVSQSCLVHAGTDMSDGLADAIHTLCQDSGLGSCIDESAIVAHPQLHALPQLTGVSPFQAALFGGDWQYLYAVPEANLQRLNELAGRHATAIHVVGRCTADQRVVLRKADGSSFLLNNISKDHFSQEGRGYYQRIRQQPDLHLGEPIP